MAKKLCVERRKPLLGTRLYGQWLCCVELLAVPMRDDGEMRYAKAQHNKQTHDQFGTGQNFGEN